MNYDEEKDKNNYYDGKYDDIFSNFLDTDTDKPDKKLSKKKRRKSPQKTNTDSPRIREETKKLVIAVISLLFSLSSIVCGAVLIYTCFVLDSVEYDSNDENWKQDDNKESEQETDIGPIVKGDNTSLLRDPMVLNIAIFGLDGHGKGENGRSDSIIILSIDERHKKIKMCSVLRDIWVKIASSGGKNAGSEDKIVHAFSYGGYKLAVRTLEENFHVKIDRVFVIDFEAFIYAIDKCFDGIEIFLTAEECKYINKFSRDKNLIAVSEGVKRLTGKQALCHVRNRSLPKEDPITKERRTDDFARAIRQRIFLQDFKDKLKTMDLKELTIFISGVGPKLKTNFTKDEIMTLILRFYKFKDYETLSYCLPERSDYFDDFRRDMSVLILRNKNEVAYKFAKFIYEDSVKDNPKFSRASADR
ncbi:MAG: LCP family protein [Oscillospiraceae bacterium]|nr:LCP family protein [Oscillospiraceae bacterium]